MTTAGYFPGWPTAGGDTPVEAESSVLKIRFSSPKFFMAAWNCSLLAIMDSYGPLAQTSETWARQLIIFIYSVKCKLWSLSTSHRGNKNCDNSEAGIYYPLINNICFQIILLILVLSASVSIMTFCECNNFELSLLSRHLTPRYQWARLWPPPALGPMTPSTQVTMRQDTMGQCQQCQRCQGCQLWGTRDTQTIWSVLPSQNIQVWTRNQL